MILLFPPDRIPGGKHISSILAHSSYGVYTFEKNIALCRDRAKKRPVKALFQRTPAPGRLGAGRSLQNGKHLFKQCRGLHHDHRQLFPGTGDPLIKQIGV